MIVPLPLLLTSLALFLAWTAGAASQIALAWEPSPDADVNAYRLYWGGASCTWTNHHELGNVTNVVFTNLSAGGHYYFAVTALNTAGAESEPSNEVEYAVPTKPRPPDELRITQTLQTAATPAGPWREIGTLASLVPAKTNGEFFRVMLSVSPPPIPK